MKTTVELPDELLRAAQRTARREGTTVSGPAVHDARIAALCLTHGVQALWAADRDLTRFPRLRSVNPLI